MQSSPAVWTTIAVDAIPRNDWGVDWVPIFAVNHSIGFSGVPGFHRPSYFNVTFFGAISGSELIPVTNNANVPVYANTTTVVTINFEREGLLKVDTSPPTDAVVYVNGTAMEPWGLWVSLLPAKYTVSFQNVTGLATPRTTTISLSPGAQTTIIGYYNNGTTAVSATNLAASASTATDSLSGTTESHSAVLSVGLPIFVAPLISRGPEKRGTKR